MNIEPRELKVDHSAASRYDAARTLAERYVKDDRLESEAWQWAVWFVYNGQQCGTRCPYWPEECFVGSDTCCECPGFEAIQIVTGHSGRVYCKNKRAEVQPWPEDVYFAVEGKERLEMQYQLPEELCPW